MIKEGGGHNVDEILYIVSLLMVGYMDKKGDVEIKVMNEVLEKLIKEVENIGSKGYRGCGESEGEGEGEGRGRDEGRNGSGSEGRSRSRDGGKGKDEGRGGGEESGEGEDGQGNGEGDDKDEEIRRWITKPVKVNLMDLKELLVVIYAIFNKHVMSKFYNAKEQYHIARIIAQIFLDILRIDDVNLWEECASTRIKFFQTSPLEQSKLIQLQRGYILDDISGLELGIKDHDLERKFHHEQMSFLLVEELFEDLKTKFSEGLSLALTLELDYTEGIDGYKRKKVGDIAEKLKAKNIDVLLIQKYIEPSIVNLFQQSGIIVVHSLGSNHIKNLTKIFGINVIKSNEFLGVIDQPYIGKGINLKFLKLGKRNKLMIYRKDNKASQCDWNILINEPMQHLFADLKSTIKQTLKTLIDIMLEDKAFILGNNNFELRWLVYLICWIGRLVQSDPCMRPMKGDSSIWKRNPFLQVFKVLIKGFNGLFGKDIRHIELDLGDEEADRAQERANEAEKAKEKVNEAERAQERANKAEKAQEKAKQVEKAHERLKEAVRSQEKAKEVKKAQERFKEAENAQERVNEAKMIMKIIQNIEYVISNEEFIVSRDKLKEVLGLRKKDKDEGKVDKPMIKGEEYTREVDKLMVKEDRLIVKGDKPMVDDDGYYTGIDHKRNREAKKPIVKSEKHTKEADKLTEEVDKPIEEAYKPTEEANKRIENANKPIEEAYKPMEKADKPTEKADKSIEGVNKPTKEADKPIFEGNKPMTNSDSHTVEITKPISKVPKPLTTGDTHIRVINVSLPAENKPYEGTIHPTIKIPNPPDETYSPYTSTPIDFMICLDSTSFMDIRKALKSSLSKLSSPRSMSSLESLVHCFALSLSLPPEPKALFLAGKTFDFEVLEDKLKVLWHALRMFWHLINVKVVTSDFFEY